MSVEPHIFHTISDYTLYITVGGDWKLDQPEVSGCNEAVAAIDSPRISSLCLNTDKDFGEWDTGVLAVLIRAVKKAKELNIPIDDSALPQGLRRLIALTLAVPPKAGSGKNNSDEGIFSIIGGMALSIPSICRDVLEFIGETACAVGRMCRGKADMRARDFFEAVRECGLGALPIVSITSLLFGLILAFVGAIQLTQFGAQMYVAGLVGIGMLRVMGAVMVGVVMSGRVGAAYAALIGTMQVNEEVDALSTMGISPVEFLVLPRMTALIFMVPLLTVYADFMGMTGGFLVGVGMLGLSPLQYLTATANLVNFKHGLIGLVYATVYGIIIALAGCYQGMKCGRSAAGVGLATTAAVVQSIVWIIVATAVITVICNVLKV